MFALLALPVSAQHVTRIEFVTFDTNVVPHTTAGTQVRLRAELYVPGNATLPLSAVVITPSSGGVREEIEIYYARELTRAGIAAVGDRQLRITSTFTFGSRPKPSQQLADWKRCRCRPSMVGS